MRVSMSPATVIARLQITKMMAAVRRERQAQPAALARAGNAKIQAAPNWLNTDARGEADDRISGRISFTELIRRLCPVKPATRVISPHKEGNNPGRRTRIATEASAMVPRSAGVNRGAGHCLRRQSDSRASAIDIAAIPTTRDSSVYSDQRIPS